MSTAQQSQIERDPKIRAAVVEGLKSGKARTQIGQEVGVSRWVVDRFAKRLNQNGGSDVRGSEDGVAITREKRSTIKPKPKADRAFGKTIALLKDKDTLPWTHRLIAKKYGVSVKVVKEAHLIHRQAVEEANGTAARKRAIVRVGELIVDLRTARHKIALDGTPEEHAEISAEVAKVESELERLEAAELERREREEAARFRTPAQRIAELEKALQGVDGKVGKHRAQCERLLDTVQTTLDTMAAFVDVRVSARQEINGLGAVIGNPHAGDPPDTLESFIGEWRKRKENKR